MRAYRDQYAELFNEGRNVVLIAISNDSVGGGRVVARRTRISPTSSARDPDGSAFAAFGGIAPGRRHGGQPRRDRGRAGGSRGQGDPPVQRQVDPDRLLGAGRRDRRGDAGAGEGS